MTIGYEALVKHLNIVAHEPFGLLSREALPTAGILNNAFGSRLACLFSPEHGWFGFAAAGEKTQGEPTRTGAFPSIRSTATCAAPRRRCWRDSAA